MDGDRGRSRVKAGKGRRGLRAEDEKRWKFLPSAKLLNLTKLERERLSIPEHVLFCPNRKERRRLARVGVVVEHVSEGGGNVKMKVLEFPYFPSEIVTRPMTSAQIGFAFATARKQPFLVPLPPAYPAE